MHSKLQTRTSGFTCQALFQVLGKQPQSSLLKELSIPSKVSSLVCATGVVYYHAPMVSPAEWFSLLLQALEDVKWMFTGMGRDGPDSNIN